MAQQKTRWLSVVAVAAAVTVSLPAGASATTSASSSSPAPSPTVTTTALTSGAVRSAVAGGASVDKAIQDYWTPARMAAAKPIDAALSKAQAKVLERSVAAASKTTAGSPAAIPGSSPASAEATRAQAGPVAARGPNATQWPWRFRPPASTTGRVFFTMHHADGSVWRNSSCSGSVINSEAKNLVVTAAHCLHRGAGFRFHSNWIFVPDYYFGQEPYGRYTLSVGRVTPQWVTQSWPTSARWDIAMVATRSPSPTRLANRVGSQGIAWNQPKHFHAWVLGYPADPPFNGTVMRYCNGNTYNDPWPFGANLGVDCTHTGGASGGPWLRSPNAQWIGWVNSVNSYKYNGVPGKIFGPYFGNEVATMYNQMRFVS